jgi:hypothetical protein
MPAGCGDASLRDSRLSWGLVPRRGVSEFGVVSSKRGQSRLTTGRYDREDDYGEEGEEKSE